MQEGEVGLKPGQRGGSGAVLLVPLDPNERAPRAADASVCVCVCVRVFVCDRERECVCVREKKSALDALERGRVCVSKFVRVRACA